VGFYQLSKILITPCVVVIERLAYGKVLSRQQGWAVALLMLGIAVATVTDTQVTSNPLGILVAAAAVLSSALYQCWAGAKQRELLVNGNQLLHQAMPLAVALLTLLAPLMEPLGLDNIGAPGTVLGYAFTPAAVAWIALSSVLGLAVTLSAFLFIGASSPITYNVVGHCRTVIIVGSGVAFFGEELGLKKACGVLCAVAGIVWYSVAPQGSALCADGGKAGSRAAAKPLLPAASEAPKDTKDCDQGSKV
jgi:solute carrier family 35 protein E3